MRLTTRALALLLLTALVGLSVGALPASAHSRLLSISPKDGAQLPSTPTEVVLTFNEDVNPQFITVRVTDSEGADVVGEEATADGPTVTLSVAEPIAAGTYNVIYRVVSADSHPISGSTTFTVEGDPQAPPSSAAPSPSATTTSPDATAGTPSTTPSPVVDETDAAGDTTQDDSDGIPAIVWVLVLLALAAVGLMLYARSRDRSES